MPIVNNNQEKKATRTPSGSNCENNFSDIRDFFERCKEIPRPKIVVKGQPAHALKINRPCQQRLRNNSCRAYVSSSIAQTVKERRKQRRHAQEVDLDRSNNLQYSCDSESDNYMTPPVITS